MIVKHQHNVTQCPEVNCNGTYLAETARKLREESLTMLEKTENLAWLNIVQTRVIHRYV